MDLLISPQIINYFIKNSSKIIKTNDESTIDLIFSNKFNRFIINKKLLNLYENEFSKDSNELDLYQNEFVNLINNKSINIISTKDNILDVLKETDDIYLRQKSCKEIYVNLSIDSNESINNNYSCRFENFNNHLSKDHAFFYLAANNPNGLTRRYYDFSTNAEIKYFLEQIYSVKTSNEINIFNRYINLGHQLYDYFKNKNYKILYYTINKQHESEKSKDFRSLNSFFTNSGLSIFRGKTTDIHERRIMFNNLIIEFDNDIESIKITETSWKFDIYICNNLLSQIEFKKFNKFNKDLTR